MKPEVLSAFGTFLKAFSYSSFEGSSFILSIRLLLGILAPRSFRYSAVSDVKNAMPPVPSVRT